MFYFIVAIVVILTIKRLLSGEGIEAITTKDLKVALTDNKKQFIDVRTPAEFNGRKIKGFKNIPLAALSQAINDLKKDQEVIVICQSGMRSASACRQFKKSGFEHVTNVRGGINNWT